MFTAKEFDVLLTVAACIEDGIAHIAAERRALLEHDALSERPRGRADDASVKARHDGDVAANVAISLADTGPQARHTGRDWLGRAATS